MKKIKISTLLLLVFVVCVSAFSVRASDEGDVRDIVNKVFGQLKSHDYGSLYDSLPAATRSRMSRDRFVSALQRAQGIYELDRMEVGAVKVSGNLAVVDTVLFGSISVPIQAEGKIVAQQYLIKEDGKWRVATGDQSTIKKFIATNPGFNKGFKIRQPRIFVKQDNKWIEFNSPAPRRNSK